MSVFFKYVGPVEDENGMTVRYRNSKKKIVDVEPVFRDKTWFEVIDEKSIVYFEEHPHYIRNNKIHELDDDFTIYYEE
jgi:hypothetical protein